MKLVSFFGLQSIPEVQAGDDIVNVIIESCQKEAVEIQPGDIVVIASKIISKSENRITELSTARTSLRAKIIGKLTGKDPALVQLIIEQSNGIFAAIPIKKIGDNYPGIFEDFSKNRDIVPFLLKKESTMLIAKVKHGLASEAGIDFSNNKEGFVSLLPSHPHESATKIRKDLASKIGGDLAVIITDTEVAFSHMFGSTEIAIGFSGIRPIAQGFGSKDRFGREKFGGADIVVDEVASAAALLMGQSSEGIPVVIFRGLVYEKDGIASEVAMEVLKRGLVWSILSTIKLKILRLI